MWTFRSLHSCSRRLFWALGQRRRALIRPCRKITATDILTAWSLNRWRGVHSCASWPARSSGGLSVKTLIWRRRYKHFWIHRKTQTDVPRFSRIGVDVRILCYRLWISHDRFCQRQPIVRAADYTADDGQRRWGITNTFLKKNGDRESKWLKQKK